MRTHQHDEEEEYSRCFDSNGQLKPGIQKVTVPLRLINSAAKKPDYHVRVEPEIALARVPGFVAADNYSVHHFLGKSPPKIDTAAWDAAIHQAATARAAHQPGFVTTNVFDGTDRTRCQDCDGRGLVQGRQCEACDGTGFVDRGTKKVQYRNAESEETGSAELEDCYSAYDADISRRWADTAAEPLAKVTGQGSHGLSGAVAGDRCTVRGGRGAYGAEGSDGHLHLIGGALVCVADGHKVTAAKQPTERKPEIYDPAVGAIRAHGVGANAIKDAAYSEYDANLRDAWRAT